MRRAIFFLALLLVGCEPKYCFEETPPPLPKCTLPTPIRLALVLGGGGARGMAHVGVLQEFQDAGIPIDLIVGCSVGSLVGALYADYPNAEHVKNVLQPIKKWDMLDLNMFKCRYGLIQGKSLCRFLDSNLSVKRFEELQIPLIVVATDLYHGQIVCLGSGPIIPAVQASCSFPFFFNPVPLYGRILVDGGVANPVPAVVACEANAQVVVVVDLCELLPRTCPTNLFEVGTRCAEIKFNKQSEVCLQDADVIIKPAVGTVGTFDDGHSTMLYNAGREAARKAIPEIKSLLSSQCGMKWEDFSDESPLTTEDQY